MEGAIASLKACQSPSLILSRLFIPLSLGPRERLGLDGTGSFREIAYISVPCHGVKVVVETGRREVSNSRKNRLNK